MNRLHDIGYDGKKGSLRDASRATEGYANQNGARASYPTASRTRHMDEQKLQQSKGSHTAEGARKRYFVKSVVQGISTAIMVVAVALAVALVGVRLAGLEVYTVLSGSMEPTYHTGSVIYVKPCEAEEVQVGDPITFVLNEDLVVATHRVVDKDDVEGKFYTKGDANAAADGAPVLYENLIGKPVFSVPYLGYVADYVQNPPGTYVAVVVCCVLLMLMFIPDLFEKDEDEEEQAKVKKSRKRKDKHGEEPIDQAPANPRASANYVVPTDLTPEEWQYVQQMRARRQMQQQVQAQQVRRPNTEMPAQRVRQQAARPAGQPQQTANPRLQLQQRQARATRTQNPVAQTAAQRSDDRLQ